MASAIGVHQTQAFAYTGNNVSVTPPPGATQVVIEAIGGGGGGGASGSRNGSSTGAVGGDAGEGFYVKSVFGVSTGTGTLLVRVGNGGAAGSCLYNCVGGSNGQAGEASAVTANGISVVAPPGLGGQTANAPASQCQAGISPVPNPSPAIGGIVVMPVASTPGLQIAGGGALGAANPFPTPTGGPTADGTCNQGAAGKPGVVILTFQ